jgi:hypothetical protein
MYFFPLELLLRAANRLEIEVGAPVKYSYPPGIEFVPQHGST